MQTFYCPVKYKLPKIPVNILHTVIEFFRQDISKEAYCKLCYSNKSEEYFIMTGIQKMTPNSVTYTFDSEIFHDRNVIQVMDIHSHCDMEAYFSRIDDHDECYPGVFAVIGKLHNNCPQMRIRAGYEGYFTFLNPLELFEGKIPCQIFSTSPERRIRHDVY